MKKIEQEAEEDVMKNEVDIFIAKMKMEIIINKSLCEEVEFLRFCFFFALEEKKKLASYILDNNGSRDQLVSQVVKLLEGGDSCARD